MGKKDFDVIVIGAGVLGCFVARELRRYNASVCVLEKNDDICAEITKANTAVIYAGYDMKPGTLKARMTVRANRVMPALCEELGVEYSRCGSLFVASGPVSEMALKKKYRQGNESGVYGLHIIGGREARDMEPALCESVTLALYSETTGTLDPWVLGIAAAKSAADGGAEFRTGCEVTGISYHGLDGNYIARCKNRNGIQSELRASAIVNAAGLYSDEVLSGYMPPSFCIVPTKAEYAVLDTYAADGVKHIIFQEREIGKGVTIVPTVSGNVLVGPSELPADVREGMIHKDDTETTVLGQEYVAECAREILPNLALDRKIRSFAGERPNIYYPTERGWPHPDRSRSIRELTIIEDDISPCLITLAGIKTPGLTCASEIGIYTAERVALRLNLTELYGGFNAEKRRETRHSAIIGKAQGEAAVGRARSSSGVSDGWAGAHRIVCRCRNITEAEVRDAVRSLPAATSVNAVKRRVGAGMGRCQGGYCLQSIIEIIADELGVDVCDVMLEDGGSYILTGSSRVSAVNATAFLGEAIGLSSHGAAAHSMWVAAPSPMLHETAESASLPSPSEDMYELAVDVAVIGGGPAGLSAAVSARESGARRVLVIERLPYLGGLLGQCIHRGFGLRLFGKELTGPEYASRLIGAARDAGIEALLYSTAISVRPTASAIEIDILSDASRISRISAGALIFAAGCRERPIGHLPTVGSRPSGMFTAGTAQRLMNVGGYGIGSKALILGSGDVGLIMARQMHLSGMDVLSVVEQSAQCGGMPRNKRECLDAFGIPLLTGHTVKRVFGSARIEGVEIVRESGLPLVESDTTLLKSGATRVGCGTTLTASGSTLLECDTLVVAVGLIPERDLLHRIPEDGRIIVCGNALTVHHMADDIADDGVRAGHAAASILRHIHQLPNV